MYYLLELCFKQGVSSFDFCIGSDQYKYEWTNEAIPTTSFVNKGFRGNAVKTAQYVRKLLKNIVALRYKWK
jgi:CelD/BcsL family acetyltransferase involved in cellulose biosynthesis